MEQDRTLQKVGLVLLIIGIIDIGIMIYCISNQMSYYSSFNIFAVLAGIFLMRGSLRTARFVASFSAFLISSFIGLLLFFPLIYPPSLSEAYLKLRTGEVTFNLVLTILVIAFLVWVYRSLTSKPVHDLMEQMGIEYKSFRRNPATGFWAGGFLAIVTLLVFCTMSNYGETAEEAKQRAISQTGPGYDYFVSSLNTSSSSRGNFVHAVVTAYNDKEIKHVKVEWSE